MVMKIKVLFISIILLGTSLLASDIDNLATYSTTYNKKANPHKDLSLAIQEAKKSKKNILLVVGGEWCKWCEQLDNFLEDKPTIAKDFYSSFEVVKVYFGKGMSKESKSLLEQFPKVKATPHFFILDSKSTLLKSIDTSKLERGYSYNSKKFTKFIKDNKTIKNNKTK